MKIRVAPCWLVNPSNTCVGVVFANARFRLGWWQRQRRSRRLYITLFCCNLVPFNHSVYSTKVNNYSLFTSFAAIGLHNRYFARNSPAPQRCAFLYFRYKLNIHEIRGRAGYCFQKVLSALFCLRLSPVNFDTCYRVVRHECRKVSSSVTRSET